jgi:glycosyltransferase involved in cell wall biosynthesis
MHFPKISIITPSFNSKKLIADTINSVLTQDYPNLEYIIIDGGSTDGTPHVIERYASNLSYWHSQKDNGQYDAINQGFSKSTGEIMCWLNADDMLLPKTLFVIAEIFEQLKEVEWISTLNPASWDANGHLAQVNSLPGFNRKAFLDGLYLPTIAKKGYWMQQESTFWRRSLWEKTGSAMPNYHLAGEFALWCKFYRHAELYGTTYPLGGFRMIEGQRSEDYKSYMDEARLALHQLREQLDWKPSQINNLIYSPLNETPWIKDILRNAYGYEGFFVKNQIMRTPNKSNWVINNERFLP